MTGFGTAGFEADGACGEVEVRSVNSRHLKLVLRLPPGGEAWEAPLREAVGGRLRRGHVELRIRFEGPGEGGAEKLELDRERARSALAALQELKVSFDLPGDVDLRLLVLSGPLLRPAAPASEVPPLECVLGAVDAAVAGLIRMREEEGRRLEADLRERLGVIGERLAEVEALAPERLERERERLRAAVRELARETATDEDRLAREIALVADRWDIGEEIVRARSHVAAFDEFLDAPGGEPVGKRLAFLGQELLRELNTIGAKANDPAITRHVVEMKNELDTLREQVENVE